MFDISDIKTIKKRPASDVEKKRLNIDVNEDVFFKITPFYRVAIDSESGNRFTVTYRNVDGEWLASLKEMRKVRPEVKTDRLNAVTLKSQFDCDIKIKEVNSGSYPVEQFFAQVLPARFPGWPNLVRALYLQFRGTLVDC